MTEEEAAKIALILIQADGQCHVCGGKLLVEAQEQFPQFDWAELASREVYGRSPEEWRSIMENPND